MQPAGKQPAVNDGFAVASLVLGLCWVFGIGSVLAVIFGAVSMHQAHLDARRYSGLAVAGLTLGVIGTVIVLWTIAALIGS